MKGSILYRCAWGSGIVAIAALLIICGSSLLRRDHAYYLSINGLSYHQPGDTLVIGKNDHLVFNNKVPDSLLKITYAGNVFHWRLRQPFYLKVNDSTINLHRLQTSDIIEFGGEQISFAQLSDAVEDHKDGQHYFSLADIFSEVLHREYAEGEINSLIYFNKGVFNLILLDEIVTIRRGGEIIRCRLDGNSGNKPLKIELVSVSKTFFISKNPLFRNRNIDVSTIRTEWQASHVLFNYDHKQRVVQALFSQPLVVSFDHRTIKDILEKSSSRTVLLSQESSLMDKRSFYFERFSSLFPLPLASVIVADSSRKIDELIYNFRAIQGEEPRTLSSIPLRRDHDLAIVSPVNQQVTTIGKLVYQSPINFILPFIFLAVITFLSAFLTLLLTNPDRFVYRRIRHSTDFDQIDLVHDTPNKTFWLLRLPVLLCVFFLLCCKLIIASKLVFTHPFFPQFYFIACASAFSIPFFIAYLWLRNSWVVFNFKRIVLLDLGLALVTLIALIIAWWLVGGTFYRPYFAAYNSSVNLENVVGLFKDLIGADKSSIVWQQYLFIPMLIGAVPIAVLGIDLAWLCFRGIKNFYLTKVQRSLPDTSSISNPPVFSSFLLSFAPILLIALGSLLISNNYSILHVIAILLVFFLFNAITSKPNRGRNWVIAILLLVPLIAIPVLKHDAGFFINYVILAGFVFFYGYLFIASGKLDSGKYVRLIKAGGILLPPVFVILIVIVVKFSASPSISNLKRVDRRVSAIIQRDEALATGGKQYLSDIQFLEIARLNAKESVGKWPSIDFHDKSKPFHPFISKGSHPVIINDLSPLVFLDYGGFLFIILLLLVWYFLFRSRYQVWTGDFQIEGQSFNQQEFNLAQLIRLIPVLILLSNSIWMLLSIFNIVFFTGRVINGFGIDSIADWFETIILASLMGFVVFNSSKENKV